MDNTNLNQFFGCEGSKLVIDPYTGLRRIEWRTHQLIPRIDLHRGHLDNLMLGIDFYEDNLLICFDKKDKLQIGDCISLLFDNGIVLDFPITKKPIKDRIYKTTFVLFQEDVETLLFSTLTSYRINYKETSKSPDTVTIIHGLHSYYDSNSKLKTFHIEEAIHAYIKNHLDTIKQLIPDFQLPRRTVVKTPIEYKFNWCYVYLMRDNTNGYHKIGISNKPEYREKTLQSEKPSIEMLARKKFPTRKIAEAIESALHTAYSQQRVRGEWFNLNDEDVAAIIETLK